MTTSSHPRHSRRHAAPRRPRLGPASPTGTLLAPVAALFATVSAATSLTGVVRGGTWLAYIAVAALLVACTGLALRSLRTPTPLVGLAQLVTVLLLVTGAFTDGGFLGIVPGPSTFAELDSILTAAFDTVRTGVPPVEGTAPIVCLATIAVGLVAIVVDTLVVAASAPAAAGLVLLCVYAVPSALADELLPWWTFVLGATAFAALLAVGGDHRHGRWRARPAAGVSLSAVSAPVAVVVGALSVGLVAGTSLTGIGTEGRLPGSDSTDHSAVGGLGINPFTSLRGMLDQGDDVPLFRVTGLGDDQRLLRAFTLDTYRPNKGWGLSDGPMPAGVPADGALPAAPGDDGSGQTREIRIEPVQWNDVWLPVYGTPRSLGGLSGGWYYDRGSGSVFRERRQTPAPYSEWASLDEPTAAELRRAEPDAEAADTVADKYTDLDYIDPRVATLARDLTASADTTFARVQAVWEYFDTANGFDYDTETAPAADGDALADFVLLNKRGYCEQFASAMAVMLRSLDIPSRVAVGFTSGYRDGDVRTIGSRDAHAWVEVYFGELGWVSFDPTPLTDGRGYVPPYLDNRDSGSDSENGGTDEGEESSSPGESSTADSRPSRDPAEPEQNGRPAQQSSASRPSPVLGIVAVVVAGLALLGTIAIAGSSRRRAVRSGSGMDDGGGNSVFRFSAVVTGLWGLSLVLLAWWVHWAAAITLLVVLALVLTPWAIRQTQRRRRLHGGGQSRHAAVHAAWRELLQECRDRGIEIDDSDTVRTTAQKIAQQPLDESGRSSLRTLVNGVERSWYGPRSHPDGREPEESASVTAALRNVLEALNRAAPLSNKDRLLPRSIVWRTRGRRAR